MRSADGSGTPLSGAVFPAAVLRDAVVPDTVLPGVAAGVVVGAVVGAVVDIVVVVSRWTVMRPETGIPYPFRVVLGLGNRITGQPGAQSAPKDTGKPAEGSAGMSRAESLAG
jgi:hypothetical protein